DLARHHRVRLPIAFIRKSGSDPPPNTPAIAYRSIGENDLPGVSTYTGSHSSGRSFDLNASSPSKLKNLRPCARTQAKVSRSHAGKPSCVIPARADSGDRPSVT